MTINLDTTSTSMLLDTASTQVHATLTTARDCRYDNRKGLSLRQPQGIVATVYTSS
ncbi:hypothetical protein KSF_051150 [Reticulibacter mediterranei]|uniref:Uncharacterized protein n=1 Tax=Reticulibacter mediterranei TaxID=2778369 RepID=A0A8J3IQF4_9CHLR|nr:hypothetical protein [Reticulibacter mediterranei]GHO95067.1 hypothetical protein KSF_051150 [Reticulibacter mediterranei]